MAIKKDMKSLMTAMTPKEIVNSLDRFIIGQGDAKRAVAIALRNRWRRMQLANELRQEVVPKNILMIGATGVGKTEISRRLARLAQAPFTKVEATKFTEVGYVGRDVESIIRDLTDSAMKMERSWAMDAVSEQAGKIAESIVLDALLPPARDIMNNQPDTQDRQEGAARQTFRRKLRQGELDEQEIEVELAMTSDSVKMIAPPGMEEMTDQISEMMKGLSHQNKKKRKITVAKAMRLLTSEQAEKLIDEEAVKLTALRNVEQNGIVFIDEIDKICKRSESAGGGEISREGVQRDLLPLVEGCEVKTKHGMVKTDHILFIASGAFHMATPADLVPELQGRFPIRVELSALSIEDFVRILTEPQASLTEQYIELLKTEDFTISFDDEAIHRLAEIAWEVNERDENIGARRLHTIMERLLDAVSFDASERGGESLLIDKKYVDAQLNNLLTHGDLSRYIL